MDLEATQKLQPELPPNEKILWSGRPRQGWVIRMSDVLFIPFSLLWGGFAIFWEYNVLTSNAPLMFPLFGAVFVVIGLYLIFGRFIYDAQRRKRTYYAVTSDRILILSEFPMRNLTSLDLEDVSDLGHSTTSNDYGNVTFGPQNPLAYWPGGSSWPGTGQSHDRMFELIRHAKTVFETIRNARKKLNS